jgi:hypothetical protein
VLELRHLARARKEELPLFDGAAGEWRNTDLITAGLTPEHAGLLVKADLGTFGELVTYMKSQGADWFHAVHGIGAETAAVIADAVAKFWGEHEDAAKEFEAEE